MGNYIFSRRTLVDLLLADANDPASHHDFGKDILPKLASNAPIYAYNFQTNLRSGGDWSWFQLGRGDNSAAIC